jgi:hypothetical protein
MSSFQYLIEVDGLSKFEVMMQEVVDRCKKGSILKWVDTRIVCIPSIQECNVADSCWLLVVSLIA